MITKFFLDKVKKNKRKQIQKVKYHAFIKGFSKRSHLKSVTYTVMIQILVIDFMSQTSNLLVYKSHKTKFTVTPILELRIFFFHFYNKNYTSMHLTHKYFSCKKDLMEKKKN